MSVILAPYLRQILSRRYTAKPWNTFGSPWTYAYTFEPRHTGFTNPGAQMAGLLQADKGGIDATTSANILAMQSLPTNVNTMWNGYSSLGSASSYTQINPLATLFSGTQSISFIFAGQINDPTPAGNWYVATWGRNSSSITAFGIAGAGTAAARSIAVVRRNDANVQFQTTAVATNGNPFVQSFIYNAGTQQATSRVNGVTIDNAIPFGTGALTTDRFTVAGGPTFGGGFIKLYWTGLLVTIGALTVADCVPVENWFMRQQRFFG